LRAQTIARYICSRKQSEGDSVSVIEQQIPTGTWSVDPIHSTALFSVRHMGIGTFRGSFSAVVGGLSDGKLNGEVAVDTIEVHDDNLKAHLLSPDFFDAERYPTVTFASTDIRTDGERLIVEGDLTIKGTTQRVSARGTIAGPIEFGDTEKIGIDLETTVDRTTFGLNWNAPLPGGKRMLEDEVTLSVHLELAKA
jgi:polyisoprenoid-binding protein YceI